MENTRPKLTDPEEFALIKQIYFKDRNPINNDLDPIERLERMESRQRNKQENSQ